LVPEVVPASIQPVIVTVPQAPAAVIPWVAVVQLAQVVAPGVHVAQPVAPALHNVQPVVAA
jgi:hypothetical protein